MDVSIRRLRAEELRLIPLLGTHVLRHIYAHVLNVSRHVDLNPDTVRKFGVLFDFLLSFLRMRHGS